jgi:hypothetical protein
VIVFIVVRRLRASGDGGGGGAEPYTPPAPAPAATTPTPSPAAPSPATSPSPVGDAGVVAGTGAPGPAGEAAGTGTPPHGDPLGAAATGDLGAGDPDSTRHGLDALGTAGTGTVPGVAPEPGPGGTSEVESGLGPVEVTTPGLPTVVAPGDVDATPGGGMVGAPDLTGGPGVDADAGLTTGGDEVGGGMVGAPDLEVPATPEGADAVNEALLDLPPNESAPGHHPDETDKP